MRGRSKNDTPYFISPCQAFSVEQEGPSYKVTSNDIKSAETGAPFVLATLISMPPYTRQYAAT